MSQNRHFGNYFVTRSHLNESELGLAVVTRSEQLSLSPPAVPLTHVRISLYRFLFLLKKYRDSIDLYRLSHFNLQIMARKQSCNVWRSAESRSRLSAMPYNYQYWWEIYPAVFSFHSFIEFAHHISPSLVVSFNLLLDEIGPREPKYCCLQQTKSDPARSRCFQVAYLLQIISFGCAPTGDNRRWQCKV